MLPKYIRTSQVGMLENPNRGGKVRQRVSRKMTALVLCFKRLYNVNRYLGKFCIDKFRAFAPVGGALGIASTKVNLNLRSEATTFLMKQITIGGKRP